MFSSLMERKLESAIRDIFKEVSPTLMRTVNDLAFKQGGKSALENYQLLGQRALIVLGGVAVVGTTISYIVARKREERRIERVVRRVLEEEQWKAEPETEA